MTQQLLGVAGSPFAYRGSIGPWPIGEALAVKLRQAGRGSGSDVRAIWAGSASTTFFATTIPGRSRSILAIRRRSRFTSWHRAERFFATIDARAKARRPASAAATAPSIAERPRVIAKLIVYAPGVDRP